MNLDNTLIAYPIAGLYNYVDNVNHGGKPHALRLLLESHRVMSGGDIIEKKEKKGSALTRSKIKPNGRPNN